MYPLERAIVTLRSYHALSANAVVAFIDLVEFRRPRNAVKSTILLVGTVYYSIGNARNLVDIAGVLVSSVHWFNGKCSPALSQ